MTPWLRALRAAGLLLVLATGAVHPAYAVEPAPSADSSRAGSLAGEGRARPGREVPPSEEEPDEEETAPADEDRVPAAVDSTEAAVAPEPSNAPTAVGQGVVRPGTGPEPVLQFLPLGSGLILIGLGLALTFFALRLRRG
ncbi:hypothetical protein [Streptomyces sp. SD15]